MIVYPTQMMKVSFDAVFIETRRNLIFLFEKDQDNETEKSINEIDATFNTESSIRSTASTKAFSSIPVSDSTLGQTKTIETTSTTKFPIFSPTETNVETTSESPSTITEQANISFKEKTTENSIEDFSNRIENNFVLRSSITTEVPSMTTTEQTRKTQSQPETTFTEPISTTLEEAISTTNRILPVRLQETTKLLPVEQTSTQKSVVQSTTVRYSTITGEYTPSSQSLKELENLLIQRTTEIASKPKTTIAQLSTTTTIPSTLKRSRKPKVTTAKPRTTTFSDEEDASFLVNE